MRIFFTSLALLLISSPGHSEFIEEWNIEYHSDLECLPNSDVCQRAITLINSSNQVSEFSATGPVILAIKNRQIVSCESNAVLATGQAKIFDLSGRLVVAFEHRGFLRDCGITPDGALYWFHYNKVLESKPKNILVVISSLGDIVYEKTLSTGGVIKFSYGKEEYEISIHEPELPG